MKSEKCCLFVRSTVFAMKIRKEEVMTTTTKSINVGHVFVVEWIIQLGDVGFCLLPFAGLRTCLSVPTIPRLWM